MVNMVFVLNNLSRNIPIPSPTTIERSRIKPKEAADKKL